MSLARKFKRDKIRKQKGSKNIKGYYHNDKLASAMPNGFTTPYAYATKHKIKRERVEKLAHETLQKIFVKTIPVNGRGVLVFNASAMDYHAERTGLIK